MKLPETTWASPTPRACNLACIQRDFGRRRSWHVVSHCSRRGNRLAASLQRPSQLHLDLGVEAFIGNFKRRMSLTPVLVVQEPCCLPFQYRLDILLETGLEANQTSSASTRQELAEDAKHRSCHYVFGMFCPFGAKPPMLGAVRASGHQAKPAAVGRLVQRDCSLVHIWLTGCSIFGEQRVTGQSSIVFSRCGIPRLRVLFGVNFGPLSGNDWAWCAGTQEQPGPRVAESGLGICVSPIVVADGLLQRLPEHRALRARLS